MMKRSDGVGLGLGARQGQMGVLGSSACLLQGPVLLLRRRLSLQPVLFTRQYYPSHRGRKRPNPRSYLTGFGKNFAFYYFIYIFFIYNFIFSRCCSVVFMPRSTDLQVGRYLMLSQLLLKCRVLVPRCKERVLYGMLGIHLPIFVLQLYIFRRHS